MNEKAEGFFNLKVDTMKILIFYMLKNWLSKFETKIREVVIFTFATQNIFFLIIYSPLPILRLNFNGVGG